MADETRKQQHIHPKESFTQVIEPRLSHGRAFCLIAFEFITFDNNNNINNNTEHMYSGARSYVILYVYNSISL